MNKKRQIKLAQRRHSLLLRGEDLARLSGVHRVYISEIENGRRRPTDGQLRSLARALKFKGDPADLLQEVKP